MNVPIPTLTSDMALVKTAAMVINPTDATMLDYSAVPGAIHGYDLAGTVVALGENVRAGLVVGDRMAGFVHGMNCLQPEIGAFAEYVGATADLLLKIPDSLSFEEAATYVSSRSVWQSPRPDPLSGIFPPYWAWNRLG
ncbi:unnamed protein product [Penicillium viridicatum]